ncbi:MAG: hypothetical protein ACRYG4_00400 [Janthinobacterium lividum]
MKIAFDTYEASRPLAAITQAGPDTVAVRPRRTRLSLRLNSTPANAVLFHAWRP